MKAPLALQLQTICHTYHSNFICLSFTGVPNNVLHVVLKAFAVCGMSDSGFELLLS